MIKNKLTQNKELSVEQLKILLTKAEKKVRKLILDQKIGKLFKSFGEIVRRKRVRDSIISSERYETGDETTEEEIEIE